MHPPKYYKNENLDSVREFINKNDFVILISQVDGKPWATHIPLLLDKDVNDKDILIGHISRANSQWKDFDANEEMLVVFSGPNAYVSASWYDHENVPTWNYIAVHVYGRIHIIEGEFLIQQLSKLVDKYESDMQRPVKVDKMTKEFVESQIKGIVGFEIEITDIQAVMKLSQNRDDKNYDRVINGLEQKGDINSLEIARLMKK
ncbi:MAG: FMN-binding negative transcriptional regulator [Bacteroidales bacterium]|nr:FMN-binding negative transcriptional regulator [Bacteroidales bacterium]